MDDFSCLVRAVFSTAHAPVIVLAVGSRFRAPCIFAAKPMVGGDGHAPVWCVFWYQGTSSIEHDVH